jgi:hypothetical protein
MFDCIWNTAHLTTSPYKLPNMVFNVLNNKCLIKCIFLNLYYKYQAFNQVWNTMFLINVICEN